MQISTRCVPAHFRLADDLLHVRIIAHRLLRIARHLSLSKIDCCIEARASDPYCDASEAHGEYEPGGDFVEHPVIDRCFPEVGHPLIRHTKSSDRKFEATRSAKTGDLPIVMKLSLLFRKIHAEPGAV